MRHVCGEVGAQLLQLAQLGNVLHDDHRAGALALAEQAGRVRAQRAVAAVRALAVHVGGAQVAGAHLHRFTDNLFQLFALENLAQRAPLGILHGHAEQLAADAVGEGNVLLAVYGNQTLPHLVQHLAENDISPLLAEHAILHAPQRRVVLGGHALRRGGHIGNAAVKAPLREVLQHPHGRFDHLVGQSHRMIDDHELHDDGGQNHQHEHPKVFAQRVRPPHLLLSIAQHASV